MNKLDLDYTNLLQDILDNGVTKQDRTGTGTLSVFGRTIRHKMTEGFPLITTKKMYFKGIVTELLWFLRSDTNIKYLVDNDCHIWDGDCYQYYLKHYCDEYNEEQKLKQESPMAWMSQELVNIRPLPKDEFINRIKTNDEFAKKWGELGPIYGAQWRDWLTYKPSNNTGGFYQSGNIDQIQNLINDLKTNPDSRRLMVSAWNVAELDSMTLPPCHYGFQVYTRELSYNEREQLALQNPIVKELCEVNGPMTPTGWDTHNIPIRAISLMWNQRSVDTFLGLPFNIASYGLLLEIIAKEVNMVPDELIGNLGDTHLYLNHIEQAKEQIGRELTHDERVEIACKPENGIIPVVPMYGDWDPTKEKMNQFLDEKNIPKRTKEPYLLPTLNIKLHFNNEPSFVPEHWLVDDFEIVNYQSHPSIKAPLSN